MVRGRASAMLPRSRSPIAAFEATTRRSATRSLSSLLPPPAQEAGNRSDLPMELVASALVRRRRLRRRDHATARGRRWHPLWSHCFCVFRYREPICSKSQRMCGKIRPNIGSSKMSWRIERGGDTNATEACGRRKGKWSLKSTNVQAADLLARPAHLKFRTGPGPKFSAPTGSVRPNL
jgi:hypothetical protein